MLRIHSIETLGTHEGPGIRFVIFLQGCNYKCGYCHNPDTQKINSGTETKIEELLDQIKKMQPYFGNNGGVTASGGEPLIQAKELTKLFKELKKSGIHTALDTNGSILNDDTKKLLEQTDLVLLDVKQIDSEWHKKITGSPNESPLAFAEYLEKNKKPFWIRYVLVPGFTDQPEHLKNLGEQFKNYKRVERVEILPYHTFGSHKYKHLGIKNPFAAVSVPTEKKIIAAEKILKKYFKKIVVR